MIVYRHRKLSNNDVFYIGITNDNKRPFLKSRRTSLWKNTELKHGRKVEIIAENISRESACELEQFLIELYGRKSEGTEILVNFTSGGDCFKHSMESKNKMSYIANSMTKEHLKKLKENSKKGVEHYKSRKVRNKLTGTIYDSIKEASLKEKINYNTLRNNVSGVRKINNTKIEYC